LQEELGAEGGSEEYARRFCGVVASFGDAHWTQMSSVGQQHLLLRHVSAACFTTPAATPCCLLTKQMTNLVG
jgi:hypothetical protein